MFSCRNCTRDFARALFLASAEVHIEALPIRSLRASVAVSRRAKYASLATRSPKVRHPDDQARIDAGLPVDVQTFKEAGLSALKATPAVKRFKREAKEIVNEKESVSILDGKTPIDLVTIRRQLKLELRHIDEPYRLAERSLVLVKNGEVDRALELVRMAGADGMDCVVAWNHILNTLSQSHRRDAAWKLFNEMKKLGQKPDSYTITILLRSYATDANKKPVSLPTALKIYDSMFAPNSSVKPQIIHSNALLEACARAGNLDMLFQVAARLPKHGLAAPDDVTYTIIFNALANANPQDEDGDHKNQQRLLSYARSIWEDVLEQWKSGRLVMNEKLICSMGRVLLKSHLKSDRDDVLSLVQQTMRIPRQFPEVPRAYFLEPLNEATTIDKSLPIPEDSPDGVSLHDGAESSMEPEVDLNTLFEEMESGEIDNSVSLDSDSGKQMQVNGVAELGDINSAIDASITGIETSKGQTLMKSNFKPMHGAGLIFAKPGNNTMSLILAACTSIKQYKGAVKYWDFLRPMFTPDTVNYIDYMKMLKDSRASSRATDVLKDIYKLSISSKSNIELIPVFFWHGLSACVRAKESKTALQDGTRILAMLQMAVADPQVELISLFVTLLGRSTADFPPKDVEMAIESLMITFANLKSFWAFGASQGNGPPMPSESLTALMHEIDPRWQASRRRHFADFARSRQDILEEAKLRMSPADRNSMRDLGRKMEQAVGRVLRMYGSSLDQNQVNKIRADLHRIRAWIFPREKTWTTAPGVGMRPAAKQIQAA